MFRIESRRSTGLLAFPLLMAVAFLVGRGYAPMMLHLWVDTSVAIRSSVLLIGPLIGGLSAWVAIRNERRGTQEMLSITPRSPVVRDLTTWAGTAFWGVAAYLLFGAVMLTLTYPNATWGAPLPGYLMVGLLAVVAASAFGFAAGYFLPSRFTAPAVAVAIFMAQGTTADSQRYSLLSPTPAPLLSLSVFEEVPQVALPQSLLFAGLGGIALALVALKHRRDRFLPRFALVSFCAIGTIGAVVSVGASPRISDEWGMGSPVPYEPACDSGELVVCVHPAYERSLPEVATIIRRVYKPLIGLPGASNYAVQDGEFLSKTPEDKDPITFYLDNSGEYLEQSIEYSVAESLVSGYGPTDIAEVRSKGRTCDSVYGGKELYDPGHEVQGIVADWLRMQAGSYSGSDPIAACKTSREKAEDFMDLDAEVRRAWLKENLEDLRDGKLTPEDLP